MESDLALLETERKKAIPSMIVETPSVNPIINELRFNHSYVYIYPFLINSQTGDKFELDVVGNRKSICINYIGVMEKKQGHGKKMMSMLTALCDKYGYELNLEICPKFGVSRWVLIKFYKRFGFEKVSHNKYMRIPNG
jgi:hypothetical protein